MKEKERNLEKVREIGIIAATLGLKIGEVLKLRSDHQREVHHFFFSLSVTQLHFCFGCLMFSMVLDIVIP